MSEIPKIPASGVDGTQTTGTSLIPSGALPPMQSASVPDAIDGLIATHSRSLGGDVAARVLAAYMRGNSNQLADAHRRISEMEIDLQDANQTISDLKVEKAQLSVRLDGILGSNRIKQMAIFFGTAVLGVAVDLYKEELTTPASLLAALGTCMLIFVVIPIGGGRDK